MSGGGKSTNSSQANTLSQISSDLLTSGGSFLKNLFAQGNEAVTTGGVGAQTPMVQQAVQQSRQATSQAMTGTKANMARAGVGRSTQGQSILAQLGLSGEQATAAIPTTFAQNLINMLLGVAPTVTGQGVSAASAAGTVANQAGAVNNQAMSPWLTSAAGVGGALGQAGVTQGAGWLSNLLSGSGSPNTQGLLSAGQNITDTNLINDLTAAGID